MRLLETNLAVPDELAAAIAFLLADDAAFMAGRSLFVYGALLSTGDALIAIQRPAAGKADLRGVKVGWPLCPISRRHRQLNSYDERVSEV
jgi:malonyl CoA-acyl carrier protein transacylase